MRLEMVGVQFDQPGQQVVTLEILARGARPFGDVGDPAVADQHRTVEDRSSRTMRALVKTCSLGMSCNLSFGCAASGSREWTVKGRRGALSAKKGNRRDGKRLADEFAKTVSSAFLMGRCMSSGTGPVSVRWNWNSSKTYG